MSKLQILITQYKEDESIIKNLLDSISRQRNINFETDIDVIIGNDGSDVKLSEDFLTSYPFPIQYVSFEHSGLPGCRKNLFNLATAPYIMYCDADDMFINELGISIILGYAEAGYNMIICSILEECKTPQKMVYVVHDNNSVFVHGMVYNVQFLRENEIEWHPDLTCHEDSPYNALARVCAGKNQAVCKIPLYLWVYRQDSICRSSPGYLPMTWGAMINAYDHLVEDLLMRGFGKEARYYAKYCFYASYYEMLRKIWAHEDYAHYKEPTLQRLKEFYTKYERIIRYVPPEDDKQAAEVNQKIMLRKGKKLTEQEIAGFDTWFDSLK